MGIAMAWNPDQYLKFADDRRRPAVDLLARIALADPGTIVDLGCGAGNVTRLLGERWPQARICGLRSPSRRVAPDRRPRTADAALVAERRAGGCARRANARQFLLAVARRAVRRRALAALSRTPRKPRARGTGGAGRCLLRMARAARRTARRLDDRVPARALCERRRRASDRHMDVGDRDDAVRERARRRRSARVHPGLPRARYCTLSASRRRSCAVRVPAAIHRRRAREPVRPPGRGISMAAMSSARTAW